MEDARAFQMKRALIAKPITYEVDPEAFPRNVHEYLHQVKEERETIFPECKKGANNFKPMIRIEDVIIEPQNDSIAAWKRNQAFTFCDLALKLKCSRNYIIELFPQSEQFSVENEKEFCLFTLGSYLYNKIFPNETVADKEGHLPRYSIVLHFSQEELFLILGYFYSWLEKIGMSHAICRWIYSILACLQKPVSDECGQFLEELYDFCRDEIKRCQEEEKAMFHMIIAILANYFCVKAYKIGPSLDKFLPLC